MTLKYSVIDRIMRNTNFLLPQIIKSKRSATSSLNMTTIYFGQNLFSLLQWMKIKFEIDGNYWKIDLFDGFCSKILSTVEEQHRESSEFILLIALNPTSYRSHHLSKLPTILWLHGKVDALYLPKIHRHDILSISFVYPLFFSTTTSLWV